MTDKEILEKVYQMVSNGYVADIQDDVKSFIEQEWQRQDDQELVDQYNRNRETKDHITDVSEISDQYSTIGLKKPKTYKMPDGYSVDQGGAVDVREIERHRGLEIGPDGTVISLD